MFFIQWEKEKKVIDKTDPSFVQNGTFGKLAIFWKGLANRESIFFGSYKIATPRGFCMQILKNVFVVRFAICQDFEFFRTSFFICVSK